MKTTTCRLLTNSYQQYSKQRYINSYSPRQRFHNNLILQILNYYSANFTTNITFNHILLQVLNMCNSSFHILSCKDMLAKQYFILWHR
jgi:hypothetical protein